MKEKVKDREKMKIGKVMNKDKPPNSTHGMS